MYLLCSSRKTVFNRTVILIHSPYAEFPKTLTPSPSPIKGEGNQKTNLAPLLPSWEKGLGDEGGFALRKVSNSLKGGATLPPRNIYLVKSHHKPNF